MAQAFAIPDGQAPNPIPQRDPRDKMTAGKSAEPTKLVRTALFISRKEKEYLVENLSVLIGSGLNIVEVLDAVEGELKTRAMRKIVRSMREAVDAGAPLWRTIQESGLFPQHVVQLIRVGEESGRLSQNLKIIAEQEDKDRKFRAKVRSALLYPTFVLSLTVVIGVGIAWFVLPRLSSVFDALDLTLPVVTRVMVALGDFLGAYGVYVMPAIIIALILAVYFVFFNKKTRSFGQELLFKLPGIKRLILEVEIGRFGFLLGTLLRAGLPISDALDSVQRATVARSYKKLYQHLQEDISNGSTFKDSFTGFSGIKKLIPRPIQQIIIAGERSANLPETLLKIGEIYESKTEITTKNLAIILEPILLVVVWLAVLVVALAVIIPLYSLLGGLNN